MYTYLNKYVAQLRLSAFGSFRGRTSRFPCISLHFRSDQPVRVRSASGSEILSLRSASGVRSASGSVTLGVRSASGSVIPGVLSLRIGHPFDHISSTITYSDHSTWSKLLLMSFRIGSATLLSYVSSSLYSDGSTLVYIYIYIYILTLPPPP